MSKPVEQLISIHLLERDENEELFWVWSFPSVEEHLRIYIKQKCIQQLTTLNIDDDYSGDFYFESEFYLNLNSNI